MKNYDSIANVSDHKSCIISHNNNNNGSAQPIKKKKTTFSDKDEWKEIKFEETVHERSFSPITKRLRSLIKTNSQFDRFNTHLSAPRIITNNNSNYNGFVYDLHQKIVKSNSMTDISPPAVKSLGHNRLRGFFKQMNDEKIGLNVNNYSFSKKKKSNKFKKSDDINEKFDQTIKSNENTNNQNEQNIIQPLLHSNIKTNFDKKSVRKEDAKIRYVNSTLENLNSSNCNGIIPISLLENRKTNNPLLSSCSTPNSTDYKRNDHKKINYLLNKLTKSHDKQKIVNCHAKLNSCNSNHSRKYRNNTISSSLMATGDFSNLHQFTDDLDDKSNNSDLSIENNWDHHDLSPQINGDYVKKSKLKLSHKLFKLFSQNSAYPKETKKTKLILTSLESISKISLDSLINLVAILSVELIINSIKHTKKVKSKRSSKNNCISKRSLETHNRHLADSRLSKSVISNLPSSSSSYKKCNLAFDLNGRVILQDGFRNINSRNRSNRSNIGSYNNIFNPNSSSLRAKHASTLSIPSGCNTPYDLSTPNWLNKGSSSNLRLNERNRAHLNRFEGRKSSQNSLRCIDNSNVRLNSRTLTNNQRPYSTSLTEMKTNRPSTHVSPVNNHYEITKNGTYKCTIPIKTKIDLNKLDEVFLLKDTLFNKCSNTILYIRPSKNKDRHSKMDQHDINGGSKRDEWLLHIESPTINVLNNSLKIVSRKFPNWDINSKNITCVR